MIHIKSIFKVARNYFKYPDDYSLQGVGINIKHFQGEGNIEIQIGNSPMIWYIEKKVALDFIRKHNTIYFAGITRLGVLPLSILKAVGNKEQTALF